MSNSFYARSAERERQTVAEYRRNGWFAVRTPGSKSAVDVIALRDGEIELVQIKTGGSSAFSGFGPQEREALLSAAETAGAQALYRWYPLHAREPKILGPESWPT